MCERNRNGEHPSCIDALLDGPGAEDHGFCEPCAVEIRRKWKETVLQIEVMKKDLFRVLEVGQRATDHAADMERLFSEIRTAALNIMHEIAADSDGGQKRYESYGPLFDAVWNTSQRPKDSSGFCQHHWMESAESGTVCTRCGMNYYEKEKPIEKRVDPVPNEVRCECWAHCAITRNQERERAAKIAEGEEPAADLDGCSCGKNIAAKIRG